VAIIHLARLLPAESSDLPGGLRRAALITPPYLVLHREEFAWPRVSPRAPVRSYIKPLRAAPFHPSPRLQIPDLRIWNTVGWSTFCCTCRRPKGSRLKFQIGNLRFEIPSDAPPLAGPLPSGVRTFLSFVFTNPGIETW